MDQGNTQAPEQRNSHPDDRARRIFVVGCSYCESDDCNFGFCPPHDASPRCESGKHNHCSCDVCF